MHIAFVSLGAFGHINPTLALVTELVKKGVRVTYFTTEAFRTIIEPTGAKFVAVPSWMAENDKHNEDGEKKEDDGGVAAAVPFLFLNEAGAYIDTVLDTLKNDKPDAVVHDFAGIAGTIAADNLRVANVMLYTSYPSNDSYSVAAGFENCPPDHPLRKAAAQLAQTYAEKYGCRLLTVKEIFDGHGDFNLVMMQKKLVPNYETFDDSFVFTGVQIGKRTAFGSWKAPDNGKPLLYSSLGTAFNNWPEYYPILFDAVRDLDINVFAALGSIDPASLKDIPANVEVGQMVPQLDILSQASVFITHAGMGGTGEAIYYGVPMIAIPQMEEQAITARQIEKLGLGCAFPDKNAITSEGLKAAIFKLLIEPSYKETAHAFSEDMRSLGGAKASAEALLAYLKQQEGDVIEGNWFTMQCARPCHDTLYSSLEVAEKLSAAEQGGHVPTELVPRCPKCGGPMDIHMGAGQRMIPDTAAQARFQTFLKTYHGKKLVVLELGIGWRNQLIKAPMMRLVASEPNATYVTINLGEIYIADNIKEKSFGLDGRLDELLPALREACEA